MYVGLAIPATSDRGAAILRFGSFLPPSSTDELPVPGDDATGGSSAYTPVDRKVHVRGRLGDVHAK